MLLFCGTWLLLSHLTSAVQHWPPNVAHTRQQYTSDTELNAALYRDGGGGGKTGNGLNLICFSDTMTYHHVYSDGTSGPGTFIPNSTNLSNVTFGGQQQSSMVHNTCALMNNTAHPTKLFSTMGTRYSSPGNGLFKSCYGSFGNEFGAAGIETTWGTPGCEGSNQIIIWPDNNMLGSMDISTLPNNQLVAVYKVLNNSNGFQPLYSTMVTVNVSTHTANGGGLYYVRDPISMFYADNETMWGVWGAYSAGTNGDGNIYLLAPNHNNTGVQVARAPWASMKNRSAYRFWNGQTWSTTQPASNDQSANIVSNSRAILGQGTLFWNSYFNAPVIVYGDGFSFYMQAFLSNDLTGGTTAPVYLFTVNLTTKGGSGLNGGYVYSQQAYPHWYANKATLLVSWAEAAAYVWMATVNFS